MELREGYQQTEIGIVPTDWIVCDVVSQFNFLGNATNPRGDLSYIEEGYSYIHYGDIHTILPTLLNLKIFNLPKISMDKVKNTPFLKEGDVIVADASEDLRGLCQSIEIASDTNKSECIAGLHTILLRPKYDNFASGFCGYLFNSELLQKQYLKLYTGLKVYGVSRTSMKSLLIAIPPKKEQQAIAEALSDADALIASLEKLIEKKNSISNSAIKSLLDGSINEQKNDNNAIELSINELSVVGRGRVISHKEIEKAQESKYPVYSSQTSNSGIMGYLDTFDFDGEYLTWTTDGANAGTVFYRNGKFNCTNVCGTLKIKAEFDAKFVSLMLEREAPRHVSRQLGNPKLMNNIMKEIKLRLPSDLEEQRRISQQVDDIKNELKALKDRLNKAKKIKAGMMQELLTGRTRLI